MDNHQPKGKYKRGRPFAKGHKGQWPRPADADSRIVICARCGEPKLLANFLTKANHKRKYCKPCWSAILSDRFRQYVENIRNNPKLIIEKLNHLDDLQAAEAKTIGSGYKNVLKWSRHLRKWNHIRSIWRTTFGLQDKRGLTMYIERMIKYGHWTEEQAAEWKEGYYQRHPEERPVNVPSGVQRAG